MATVLNQTVTDATSYTSGLLDVSALKELVLDFDVASITSSFGVYIQINRIAPNGKPYPLYQNLLQNTGVISTAIGVGTNTLNFPFGDSIQVDLLIQPGDSISMDIEIVGK